MSRLFPFQRGLMHAYWAPNFWALYATADKVADQIARKYYGFTPSVSAASLTGGLVMEQEFAILPQITPRMTFLLTISFTLVRQIKLKYHF